MAKSSFPCAKCGAPVAVTGHNRKDADRLAAWKQAQGEICSDIHATNDRKHKRYRILEDQDEADIIAWICQNHGYECIGDLCMGRGLVGRHAVMAGRRFVGTELNPKRLAVLIEWIAHNMLERAIHEPS